MMRERGKKEQRKEERREGYKRLNPFRRRINSSLLTAGQCVTSNECTGTLRCLEHRLYRAIRLASWGSWVKVNSTPSL